MKSRLSVTLFAVAMLVAAAQTLAGEIQTLNEQDVPAPKRTSLGLYLTSAMAYNMWEADPENVRILDVRTVEEFIFVGHARMAWSIPFALQTYEWTGNGFAMTPNPGFIQSVRDWAATDNTILVMCRSGGRSARAVNALAEAGYTRAYNIIDGMEGDMVRDPDDPNFGKRMKNGWKNANLPWTYDIDPARMRVPADGSP